MNPDRLLEGAPNSAPTPHDIAQLASTWHRDRKTALEIATASGRQSDAEKTEPQPKKEARNG